MINLLNIFTRAFKRVRCFPALFFLLVGWSGNVTSPQAETLPELLIVQVPSHQSVLYDVNGMRGIVSWKRQMEGSRIVRLSPGGNAVNLTPEFNSACDPAVSFDGQSILFSGRKKSDDPWQIWRMDRDGKNEVLITPNLKNCFSPLYTGVLFHLDDDIPTDQIIFTSTGHGWVGENDGGPVPALYVSGLDGQNPERITYNIGADFDPDVLPNGRIVFSSKKRDGSIHLLAVNNDGTDLMLYADRTGIMPCVGKDRVYFIEPKFVGGGNLCYVSQRRPIKTYQTLCRSGGGHYLSPCPLPDGGLLASYLTESNKKFMRFDLYRIDPDTGERLQAVYSEAGWHSVDAQVLAPHKKVKGRSTVVKLKLDTGVFFCLDVYESDRPEADKVEPGSVKNLRVIEGVPRITDSFISPRKVSNNESLNSVNRILGIVPVEPDGSFHIEVPAKTPLKFQALDENGMALQTQDTWTWVLPNEKRGCIGCHEDRELSPPNQMVQAVVKPAVQLIPPPQQRRTVDFLHQIKPIVEANCSSASCHAGTDLQNYQGLMESSFGKNLTPGSAKNSPLIWRLFGKKLGEKPYSGKVSQMPPDRPLSKEEKQLFIEWIDLGATWNSRHDPSHTAESLKTKE